MATQIGTLVVNVVGDASRLSTALGAAEKTIERFGSRMFFLGSRISAGVTLPIVGFMAAVNKMGTEFDSAMTESLAIMDDTSESMVNNLKQRAFEIARVSKFGPAEVAKGYYDLASAGFTAEGALQNIGTVAKFAQAGLMSMDVAGEYLAGAVKALTPELLGARTETEAMAKAADMLTMANNKSLGTVEDFSQALTTRFARGMKQVGMEASDGIAILMAFAQQNVKGKTASMQAYQALRDMQSATINAGKAWKDYGVSVYNAAGEMRPMVDILDLMQMRFKGFSKEQTEAYATTGIKPETPAEKPMSDRAKQTMLQKMKIPLRSVAATQALFGQESQIREWSEMIRNAAGETERVFEKQGQAMAVRWQNAWDAMIVAGVKFYDSFKPILIEVFDLVGRAGDKLGELAEKFDTLDLSTKKWVAGAAIGAALLGPTIMLFGSLTLAVSGLARFAQLGAAGIALVGKGVLSIVTPVTTLTTAFPKLLIPLNYFKAWIAWVGSPGGMGGLSAWFVRLGTAITSLSVTGAANLDKLWKAFSGFRYVQLGALIGLFNLLRPAFEQLTGKSMGFTDNVKRLSDVVKGIVPYLKQWWETAKNLGSILQTLWGVAQFGLVQLVKLGQLISSDLQEAWNTLGRGVTWAKETLYGFIQGISDVAGSIGTFVRGIPILGPLLGAMWDIATVALHLHWEEFKSFFNWIGSKLGWLGNIGKSISDGLRHIMPTEYVALVDTLSKVAKEATGFHDAVRRGADGLSTWADQMGMIDLKARRLYQTMAALQPVLTRTGRSIDPNALGGAVRKFFPGAPGYEDDDDATPKTAKRDPVKEALDELMGAGGRDWKNTFKAWEQNKQLILGNEAAVNRLRDAYMEVRDSIELIPEFEKKWRHEIDKSRSDQSAFSPTALDISLAAWRAGLIGINDVAREHGDTLRAIDAALGPVSEQYRDIIPVFNAYAKAQERVADGARLILLSNEGFTEIVKSHSDMAAQLKDKEEELYNHRLTESERGLKGIVKNLGQQKLAHQQMLAASSNSLRKLTGEQLKEGIRLHLEKIRMSQEFLDIEERLSLERLAGQMGIDQAIIRSFKHMTTEKIKELHKFMGEAAQEKALWDSLASSLASLADSFGASDDSFIRWLANISSAMSDATKAGADLAAALEAIRAIIAKSKEKGQSLDWGGLVAASLAVVDAVAQGAAAIAKATSSSSRKKNIMGGAMAGAKVGANPMLMAMSGGTSVLIGMAIGAIVGAIRGKKLRDVMRNVGRDWGTDISEELAKKITETMKKIGGNRQVATAMHFGDILEEAGGLNAGNFNTFRNRLNDFLVFAETGLMSGADALAEYSENFEAFADYLTGRGENLANAFGSHLATMSDQLRRGVLSQRDIQDFFSQNFEHFISNLEAVGGVAGRSWQAVLDLANQLDKMPKGVSAFLTSAVGDAGAAWDAVLKGIAYQWDGLGEKITDVKEEIEKLNEEMAKEGGVETTNKLADAQSRLSDLLREQSGHAKGARVELERMGGLIMATFAAGLQNGVGWTTMMAQLKPSFETLSKSFKDLGMAPESPVLTAMMKLFDMFSKNEALFTGIDALTNGMIALSKIGGLTTDTFDAIAKQGVDMFRRVQSVVSQAGGSHADALRPFLPWLAEMRNAAKEYGFVLDDTTQQMIDQAIELGLLKDPARTTTEVMETGFDNVNQSLMRMIDLLETAFERLGLLADEASNFPGIPTGGGNSTPGRPNVPGPAPSPTPEQFATFGGGGGNIEVPVYLDGRLVARGIVPHIPGEVTRAVGR